MRKKKEKAPPSKNKMKALINATKMTCSTTSKKQEEDKTSSHKGKSSLLEELETSNNFA